MSLCRLSRALVFGMFYRFLEDCVSELGTFVDVKIGKNIGELSESIGNVNRTLTERYQNVNCEIDSNGTSR